MDHIISQYTFTHQQSFIKYSKDFTKEEHFDLKYVKKLIYKYNLKYFSVSDYGYNIFTHSCLFGYFDVVKWMASKTNPKIYCSRALYLCAGTGNITIAQFLTEKFNLARQDIKCYDTLAASCENGHLDFAKWLTKAFQLNSNDAKHNNWCVYTATCFNGHLDCAEWFKKQFNIKINDADVDCVKAAYAL